MARLRAGRWPSSEKNPVLETQVSECLRADRAGGNEMNFTANRIRAET